MGVNGKACFYIFIYLPIYFIFKFFQRLYWFCNGMSDIVDQIEAGQLYERSAHVFDIQWKVKKEAFHLLSKRNFIATHRSFEHPNYVLNYNVSLLAVELDQALFVEVPHGYDIFDCRKSPFIHIGQFKESVRIITMPLSAFFRCAEELGDPKSKVIWLHSTGRCGSTAMSQVFEAIPNCTTVSEPMCMFTYRNEGGVVYNTKKYRQLLNSETYENVVKATARMMAKPNEHNPDILFIKNFTLSGVIEVPLLEQMFPNDSHLFLYRDCLDTVQSYLKSLNSHFWMALVMKLRANACLRYTIRSPKLLFKALSPPEIIDMNQWLNDTNTQLDMSAFGLLVIQWSSCCQYYTHLVNTTPTQMKAIRYEDIVEHKDATLHLLFEFCGISLDYMELAKKSLEADSQAGTCLSMTTLNQFKKTHITDELINEGNFYLKGFQLPPLTVPTYLPRVLSPSIPSQGGAGDHPLSHIEDGLGIHSNLSNGNGHGNGHISIQVVT